MAKTPLLLLIVAIVYASDDGFPSAICDNLTSNSPAEDFRHCLMAERRQMRLERVRLQLMSTVGFNSATDFNKTAHSHLRFPDLVASEVRGRLDNVDSHSHVSRSVRAKEFSPHYRGSRSYLDTNEIPAGLRRNLRKRTGEINPSEMEIVRKFIFPSNTSMS